MPVIFDGPQLLGRHDWNVALLAASICALGSFITLFLFAQARDMRGQARGGWLFLAGFATGTVIWTTQVVALLALDPGVPLAFDPEFAGGAFFASIIFATAGLTAGVYGNERWGFVGGAIVGMGAVAVHLLVMGSLQIAGTVSINIILLAAGGTLGIATSTLAFGRSRTEGRNVQFVAPLLMTGGILAVHFVGISSLTITPDPSRVVSPDMITSTQFAYFAAAMSALLVSTGLATALIARGARLEARTQLRSIADASVEGLILTDGRMILDVNESARKLVGPIKSARLRHMAIWELLDYRGDRTLDRFEAHLQSDSGAIPIEVIARESQNEGGVRRIFALRDLRERRAAEQRIRYLAHFDTLTGLPNRASFQEHLEQDIAATRAKGGELALMILDLDRFKEINDIHGHAAGDDLLKATASRITSLLSHNEFAARLGGDEFVIIQNNRDQPASAARLTDQLIAIFADPFTQDGQPFQVGMTIGVAIYPRDGDDAEKLLANADLALYRAKDQGRGRARFFTPDMDEVVRERRILAQQLTHAIENDELEIHYQAQASVQSGEVIGFEALVRWAHPTHGFIPPSKFIPIAEETDLILHLGEWVLRRVCQECAGWAVPYPVAVNISPIQFKISNLPELIHSVLIETGMPANRLELEITESALIEDLQRTLDMLRKIKALGVSIAMDDFGTGYSSLSTLQAFPFDKLKIDKSFVDKIDSKQQATVIVTAVLGLGRSLDIPVLAEGVESQSQLSFLLNESCQQAQGYFFGRPVPLSAIAALVNGETTEAPEETRAVA